MYILTHTGYKWPFNLVDCILKISEFLLVVIKRKFEPQGELYNNTKVVTTRTCYYHNC